MYFFIPVILFLAVIGILFCHFRKKRIIKKICCMCQNEKLCLLDELTEPLGYRYDPFQEIFTSTTDAWQKKYGYTALYDRAAPFFSMIFDCKPVYFDYDGKTWLFEVWKGQYGINTGAEIGLYCADRIVPPCERYTTIFQAVDINDYLDMGMELFYKGRLLACRQERHWWLTAFCIGHFADPKDLSLNISIHFCYYEMCRAFTEALTEAGYCLMSLNLCLYCADIPFSFGPVKCPPVWMRILRRIVLWKNKTFCRLFHWITRPFCETCDKLLYLYFFLPYAFRHMLRLKRLCFHRHKRGGK